MVSVMMSIAYGMAPDLGQGIPANRGTVKRSMDWRRNPAPCGGAS
jgi:hypothetical protein